MHISNAYQRFFWSRFFPFSSRWLHCRRLPFRRLRIMPLWCRSPFLCRQRLTLLTSTSTHLMHARSFKSKIKFELWNIQYHCHWPAARMDVPEFMFPFIVLLSTLYIVKHDCVCVCTHTRWKFKSVKCSCMLPQIKHNASPLFFHCHPLWLSFWLPPFSFCQCLLCPVIKAYHEYTHSHTLTNI